MAAVAQEPQPRRRSLTPQGQRRLSNPVRLPTANHAAAASNAPAFGGNRTPPRNGLPPWNPGGLAPLRRSSTPPPAGSLGASRTPPRSADSAPSASASASWAWNASNCQENLEDFPTPRKNPLLRASPVVTAPVAVSTPEGHATARRASQSQVLSQQPEVTGQRGTPNRPRTPPQAGANPRPPGSGGANGGNSSAAVAMAAALFAPAAAAPAPRGDCVTTTGERLGAAVGGTSHVERFRSSDRQQPGQPGTSDAVLRPWSSGSSTEEELCQHWESWAQAVVLAVEDGSDLPELPFAASSTSQVPQSLLRVIEASTVAAAALARASTEKQGLQIVVKSLESELARGRQDVRRLQDALNEMSEERARIEANLREDLEEYRASLESAHEEVQRLRRPCVHCEDAGRRLVEATTEAERVRSALAETERARSALQDSETLRRKEIEDAWCTAETAEAKHRHTLAVLRDLLVAHGANARGPLIVAEACLVGSVAGKAARRSGGKTAKEIDAADEAEQRRYGTGFEAEPEEEAEDADDQLASIALAPAPLVACHGMRGGQAVEANEAGQTLQRGGVATALDTVVACPDNEANVSPCPSHTSSVTVASSKGGARRSLRGSLARYGGNSIASRYVVGGGAAGAAAHP